MGVKKLLAGAGAAAMFASAAALGAVVTAAPAQAAGQTVTVTPNTNLKGGQVVTVTYSGFSPSAPVAVGVCPTPRIENIKGPGDCGRSKNGNSKLTTADASGKGTAQITVPEGALGNATPPAAKCPPCSIGATNIGNAKETANVELKYAGASGSSSAAKNAAAPKAKAAKAAAAPKDLAKTGPRETLIMALVGFALLQVGLVFAVRANRSTPRRTVA